MKLSIISDEYTSDPWTAFELGRRWGFDDFELRQAYRFRLPVAPQWVVDRTVAAAEAFGVNVTGISPGLFKPTMNVDGGKVPVGVDTPDEVNRHISELLPRFFEFAEKVGTKDVTVFALGRPPGTEGKPVPSIVIDALARAAEKASDGGFQLLLENGPASWANSGANCREILDKVGSEALRLVWDPANVARGESPEDPVAEGYPLIRKFVGNVHVKDTAVTPEGKDWTMLGDGVVDWRAQLTALEEDGYDGFLTLEPHLQYANPVNLVEQVEMFISRMRGLLEG